MEFVLLAGAVLGGLKLLGNIFSSGSSSGDSGSSGSYEERPGGCTESGSCGGSDCGCGCSH